MGLPHHGSSLCQPDPTPILKEPTSSLDGGANTAKEGKEEEDGWWREGERAGSTTHRPLIPARCLPVSQYELTVDTKRVQAR